jgi:hypothetical protein
MKKLILGALLLLSSFVCIAQEFYYDKSFIRDHLGKFQSLNKSGYFEIEKDSVCLFNQKLKISSWRVSFDEQSVHHGTIYTCTDGSYYYTLYLTVNNELFFYTKEKEMIKFLLKPVIIKT